MNPNYNLTPPNTPQDTKRKPNKDKNKKRGSRLMTGLKYAGAIGLAAGAGAGSVYLYRKYGHPANLPPPKREIMLPGTKGINSKTNLRIPVPNSVMNKVDTAPLKVRQAISNTRSRYDTLGSFGKMSALGAGGLALAYGTPELIKAITGAQQILAMAGLTVVEITGNVVTTFLNLVQKLSYIPKNLLEKFVNHLMILLGVIEMTELHNKERKLMRLAIITLIEIIIAKKVPLQNDTQRQLIIAVISLRAAGGVFEIYK
jgi:hypothetical protein